MQIIYEPRFVNSFNNIWDYIAKDSRNRANKFKKELKGLIESLPFMPYKCRKSIYFNNEDMRDLIYKGYTVVYKIDEIGETITIVGIKKYQNEVYFV